MSKKVPSTVILATQLKIDDMHKALKSIEKAIHNNISQDVFDAAYVSRRITEAWTNLSICASDIPMMQEVWDTNNTEQL